MTSNRCAIFIDGAYLAKVLKCKFEELRIDFEKFSKEIAGDVEILRTYYYHCMPYQDDPPTSDQKDKFAKMDTFIYTLRKLNRYEVRLGKLVRRFCDNCRCEKYEQKRVDVLMAVDLVQLSATHQIDRAILVTDDSDFVPAVDVAKNHGVLIQLYYGEYRDSDELYDICDERFEITVKLIEKVKRTS